VADAWCDRGAGSAAGSANGGGSAANGSAGVAGAGGAHAAAAGGATGAAGAYRGWHLQDDAALRPDPALRSTEHDTRAHIRSTSIHIRTRTHVCVRDRTHISIRTRIHSGITASTSSTRIHTVAVTATAHSSSTP
jgi:hypothetical protein